MASLDFAGSRVLDRDSAELSRTAQISAPLIRVRRDINLVQLHDDLWRVTRADGDVLGYVESYLEEQGRRFRSKRLIARQRRFVPLGEFWSFDDAVDCLRFG